MTHPQDVLKIFTSFYKNIHSGTQTHPQSSSLEWLNNLHLPTLTEQQIKSLNEPCTDIEITNIIKTLKSSTAPGPDGFSTSYYKKICSPVGPQSHQIIYHFLLGGHFPDEMLLANLSLIPKPQKDHSLPQNIHPISVLNYDLKLFGRLLANRLASVITLLTT